MILACGAVALLYYLAGLLAHAVATPVGQATIIWPAAGIALAAVLVRGPKVWPGIWLGSFAIGCQIAGVFADGVNTGRMVVPALVACGAVLQALVVGGLARQRYGRPIRLGSWVEALSFVLFVGPMGTVISASIGTAALVARGVLRNPEAVADTWSTWWVGDLLGVVVVVPLVLFTSWSTGPRLLWRERPVPAMTNGSLMCVLLCICGSFFAFSTLSRAQHERSEADFTAQSQEVLRLIESRLFAYGAYVDGGAALLGAETAIDAAGWDRLVEVLNLQAAMPGTLGLGLVQPVADADLARFAAASGAADGRPLDIHPQVEADQHYIIRHIAPPDRNEGARGLDLAVAPSEVASIESATRRGVATMSSAMRLVQDPDGGMGMAILRAVYPPGVDPGPRTEASQVLGWVYTPIILNDFFDAIAGSDEAGYRLRVFDAATADAAALVYDSHPETPARNTARHHFERPFRMFARDWTVSFESTPAFDAGHGFGEAKLLLVAGLVLSLVLGAFLTLLLRREYEVMTLVDAKTRALETQEGHTRSIIDTAMVGIVLLEPRGRILSLNRAAESIFGQSASELAGRRLSELLAIDGMLAEESSGGRSCQLAMRRLDGSLRQIEVQVNSWEGGDGERRATAILRDVTIRHRAEAQLRENERRLNMAMTGAQIAVFDIDLRDGSEVVSDNWVTLMGYPAGTRAETLDARAEFESRVLSEDRPLVAAADRDCIEGRTERSICEYRVNAADGSLRWMRSVAMVSERDTDGTPTRFLGVQTDVTQLRHALEVISQKESQFRAVIENAPMGMALLDDNCRLLRVNESFCRFTGHSTQALLGRTLGELIPPGGRVISDAERAQLRSGEVPVLQMERPVARRDGSVVWGLLNISLMSQGGSDGVTFIVQVQDITERRKVEQLKSDFVATVSHELRTPLTSIKGALGLVLGTMGKEMPAKAERLLSIGQKNCDRLIMLVNDILDLEKLNSGKMRFDMVEAPLAGLMEQAVAVNQPYADELGVAIRLEPVPAGLALRVDRERFGQVMSNLLSNAAKFSPRGTAVTLAAGPGAAGGTIEIRVRDRGPGIPDEFRSRIFTPFSQADSSATREKGGTGLGLNITRQILEQMDGAIDFANQPEGGCEFRVTFPAVTHDGLAEADARAIPAAGAGEGRVPSILHVEDDADFAEVFRSAFGERARVETAGSIAEARRALSDGEFDLVVIDWALSDGDGRVLLDEITRPVPIFGLSASEPAQPDARVARQAVKSRARLDQLVGDCLAFVA